MMMLSPWKNHNNLVQQFPLLTLEALLILKRHMFIKVWSFFISKSQPDPSGNCGIHSGHSAIVS